MDVGIDGIKKCRFVAGGQRCQERFVLVGHGVLVLVRGRVATEVGPHARLDHAPQLQAVVVSGPLDDQLVEL